MQSRRWKVNKNLIGNHCLMFISLWQKQVTSEDNSIRPHSVLAFPAMLACILRSQQYEPRTSTVLLSILSPRQHSMHLHSLGFLTSFLIEIGSWASQHWPCHTEVLSYLKPLSSQWSHEKLSSGTKCFQRNHHFWSKQPPTSRLS